MSVTQTRSDISHNSHLDRFLGRGTQHDLDTGTGTGTGRTFRHPHPWCWNIEPVSAITGAIAVQIQLDGTYLAGGWSLLLATNGATGHVLENLNFCEDPQVGLLSHQKEKLRSWS